VQAALVLTDTSRQAVQAVAVHCCCCPLLLLLLLLQLPLLAVVNPLVKDT
jgi:hypothetical protein